MAAQETADRPAPDPRNKVLKKFRGKFLPKGPLRERHRELMKRWESGDDHGGVVECDSRPGRTRFRVRLPVWQGEPVEEAEE